MKTRLTYLCCAAWLVAAPASASAQGIQAVGPLPAGIDSVRSLYAAAAYEDALAAMPAVSEEPVKTDFELYRALCLLALGREQESAAAVERLVRSAPSFVPPTGDVSPRMQALLTSIRARLVPDFAREAYAEAKVAYEANDHPKARASFQRAAELIDSLPADKRQGLEDLRLLAGEFLKLSRAVSVRPEPVAPSAAPVTEVVAYVAPIPIREKLPSWIPADSRQARTEYVGLLRLDIDEDGRVRSASILKTSHPAYDAAALQAARGWTYKPATRAGVPIASQRDIQIRLAPR